MAKKNGHSDLEQTAKRIEELLRDGLAGLREDNAGLRGELHVTRLEIVARLDRMLVRSGRRDAWYDGRLRELERRLGVTPPPPPPDPDEPPAG